MRDWYRSIAVYILCLAALTAGAAAQGCGPAPHDERGDLVVQVTLPAGTALESLRYRVTGNDIQPITQTIPIQGSPATTLAYFFGLPARGGYTIAVSGASADGFTSCAATAMATVKANQSTTVRMALVCTRKGGEALITGVFVCHLIDSAAAGPARTAVGGDVDVAVHLAPDAGAATFAWTASSGTFASPNAGATTFRCTAAGPADLTVTVSSDQCSDHITLSITCVPG